MKNLINIVLIVIMLFTILPIKQVGDLISGGTMIEELVHIDSKDMNKGKEVNYNKHFLYFEIGGNKLTATQTWVTQYGLNILPHPPYDIIAPPPNA